MKIAIIGYGRMGRLVETMARARNHEISCVIDKDDTDKFTTPEFLQSDVAIEFSTPDSAVDGILNCFAGGVPVVCGTTGWLDSLPRLHQMCNEGKGTLLFSSNFSIGMNIFMMLNRYMAKLMNGIDAYRPVISETHHIHKLDHPSGTAVSLAEDIVKCYDKVKKWKEPDGPDYPTESELPVFYRREGEVPGIHTVVWDSDFDTIRLTHSAKSRDGFALGAVKAAEWLKGKNGFFTMQDVISELL